MIQVFYRPQVDSFPYSYYMDNDIKPVITITFTSGRLHIEKIQKNGKGELKYYNLTDKNYTSRYNYINPESTDSFILYTFDGLSIRFSIGKDHSLQFQLSHQNKNLRDADQEQPITHAYPIADYQFLIHEKEFLVYNLLESIHLYIQSNLAENV